MKRFPVCLLPLLGTVASAAPDKEPAGNPSEVALYTQFAQAPSDNVVAYMKAELDTIMAPLDLRFQWRALEEATGQQVAAELMVVRFRGLCQVNILPPARSKDGPLGWTHISDGQILPFTDVDCDRIRDLLAARLAIAIPSERPQMLGRAMARIIAHEMYHFLSKTTRHASSGIAKKAYTAGDLACAHLAFDREGLELLREHMVHWAGEPPHGSP